jgi:hypothetical protein
VTGIQANVRTRHVFFIGGFDPKGASSFYQQHRAELAHYCALSGVPHTLGPRQRVDAFSQTWTARAQHTPEPVDTVFEYLVWDDVVRSLWARNPMALARQGLRSLWDFSIGGSIRHLHALAPATAYAALFPYALVLLALVGVIGASALAYALLTLLSQSSGVVALGTALVKCSHHLVFAGSRLCQYACKRQKRCTRGPTRRLVHSAMCSPCWQPRR